MSRVINIVQTPNATTLAVIPDRKDAQAERIARTILGNAGLPERKIDEMLGGQKGKRTIEIDISNFGKQTRNSILQNPLVEVIEYPPITPLTAKGIGDAFIRAKDEQVIRGYREQLRRAVDEAPHQRGGRTYMVQAALACDELAGGPRDSFFERGREIEAARTSRDEAVPGMRREYEDRITACQNKKKNMTITAVIASIGSVLGITIDPQAVFNIAKNLLDEWTTLPQTALIARAVVVGIFGGAVATFWAMRHRLDRKIADLRVEREQAVSKFINDRSEGVKRLRQELDKFIQNKLMEIQLATLDVLMKCYKEYVRWELYINGMDEAYTLDFSDIEDRRKVLAFYKKVMGEGNMMPRGASVTGSEKPETVSQPA